MDAAFLEASTYTWPLQTIDMQRVLEEIILDSAIGVSKPESISSKYDYFCGQL
jgi:hypothetical protein